MSLLKEIVEIPQNAATDDLVKSFADSLNKKLAEKLIKISNGDKDVELTEEERRFLKVQAGNPDNFSDEVEIETSKEFIIKKGKKALKVNTEVFDVSAAKNTEDILNKRMAEIARSKSIEYGLSNMETEEPKAIRQEPIRTVNKNAYEIRNDILMLAFNFLKWQAEINTIDMTTGKKADPSYTTIPRPDDVLEIARKFYAFVENNNRRMYE